MEGKAVSTTTMHDMLAMAGAPGFALPGLTDAVRCLDGWRRPLSHGGSFRHDYDADVARGGWEFHLLRPGLSIAIIDVTTVRNLPRRHDLGDLLVMSAVVEGASPFTTPWGDRGELLHGYCTVYGMERGQMFETLYPGGRALKWVTVFIERTLFMQATGVSLDDLPPPVRRFIEAGVGLPQRNVALSSAASLSLQQVFERPYRASLERAFLTAKALELVCHLLHDFQSMLAEMPPADSLSRADHARLDRARRLIANTLDEPLNIDDIARAVGLPRQKLQAGFRLLYGDTVARVRDRARMERALTLIRTTDISVIQVGLEAGYDHPGSFTRAFKAAFGVAPLEMRRICRREATLARARATGPLPACTKNREM